MRLSLYNNSQCNVNTVSDVPYVPEITHLVCQQLSPISFVLSPSHIDCSPGEMEGEAEELAGESAGQVSPDCRPRSPWTGTSGGSPGSAGKAGG